MNARLVKVVELLPKNCIVSVDCCRVFEDGRVVVAVAACGENGRYARYVATFDGRRIYIYLCACDGEKVEEVCRAGLAGVDRC